MNYPPPTDPNAPPPPKSGLTASSVLIGLAAAAAVWGWWTLRDEERKAEASAQKLEREYAELEAAESASQGSYLAHGAGEGMAGVFFRAPPSRSMGWP